MVDFLIIINSPFFHDIVVASFVLLGIIILQKVGLFSNTPKKVVSDSSNQSSENTEKKTNNNQTEKNNPHLQNNPENKPTLKLKSTAVGDSPKTEVEIAPRATPEKQRRSSSSLASPKTEQKRVGIRLFGEKKVSELGNQTGLGLSSTGECSTKREEQPLTDPINHHDMHLGKNNYDITYTRPSSKTKLAWDQRPKSVLVIKKWHDQEATSYALQLIRFLKEDAKIATVMIERSAQDDLKPVEEFIDSSIETSVDPSAQSDIDLIICLGGDGSVLYVSSIFQRSHPPVLTYNMGSMGFLSPFTLSAEKWKSEINHVLESKFYIKLRLRLTCTVVSKGEEVFKYRALNEAVIDRGSSPYLTKLQCYCDDKPITTVQADGIIIASATGSTAYSLSAGGSLVHPMIPAILFTPICPHALSSRPVVLPSSCTLRIQVPTDSSTSAQVSFDGKHKKQLHPGDYLGIRVSKWPVPTISQTDEIGEWFQSLAKHLMWNERILQKDK